MSYEVTEVARLYNRLANFIKDETGDEYFNFNELSEEGLENQLLSFVNDPMKRIYIVKENDNVIGFIAGEIINCFLPISKISKVGYVAGEALIPSSSVVTYMTNTKKTHGE